MKKTGVLILAAAIGLGFSSNVHIPVAIAAESTPTILPINLAVDGTVTASGENGSHEGKEKAFDQYIFSKWLTFNTPAWLQYEFTSAKIVNSYSITTADDEPGRDPKSWVLKGSNDGIVWDDLDTQQNQSFTSRHQTKTYSFANTAAYKFVKFDNFANQYDDGGMLQLSEIKLFGDDVQTFSTIKPTVTASGENAPDDIKSNLVDGSSNTKWLTWNNTAWLQFDFGEQVMIDDYALTSAKSYNNSPDADPRSWVLQGSNDSTNWTDLDTKSDENFKLRHQRKHYLLNNNTNAYQYYRLNNIQNHSGYALQVSEVEFSRTNDMWHTENPIIEVQNLAGYSLFDQALPNAQQEILTILRKLNEILYKSPAEMPVRVKKILVEIVDTPGVAWMSGDNELKTLGISSQYLASFAANNPNNSLRDEIIGILYHELGHAYQYSDFDVEAVADSLRYETGYHNRYGISPGGTWSSNGTANFIRWIEDTKHRGFIRALNAERIPYGMNEQQIQLWKESQFQSITGIDVNTLWSQYQQSLSNH
ncbi:discoidin domain-containing protein [Paenibacillus alvei]|uniref:basic secretory protein-like protein n=1 Tax=Paenibacillus alvei TaxID=44250 RepID=UPI000287E5B1|nr:basic secretory protein-like protein [Paenibacillus alvei]EJW17739.1 F5/8 type C domain protein [Paenibacillus alvei DSM 29]MCY9544642.1 discoidin domain-containing protein [Paenibacillus alvei]MCY9707262.1 discoidin domain-containing protein [Paenibacillus alvei]MCY9733687.1 discoidin domain-containing protein [Paenibacillus alvei]MCY9755410.1 discoidin domain-containing protein [Paenibacillus alvei]